MSDTQDPIPNESTKPKVEIRRELVPGYDNIRIFHGKVLLSKKRLPIITSQASEIVNLLFMEEQLRLRNEFQKEFAGMPGHHIENENEVHPLVTAILDLPGVEFAAGVGYQLIVVKGKNFSWGEGEPQGLSKKILLLMSAFSLDIQDDDQKEIEKMFADLKQPEPPTKESEPS